jgi:nicotinamidase/pyrazinamidase
MTKVFIVVDVQVDFCEGGALEVPDTESLIAPLNKAIKKAASLGMTIIFNRDWHPENHKSFKASNGQWETHCVQNTPGAQLHPDLIVPIGSYTVDKGTTPDSEGYSPYCNPLMNEIVDQPEIKTVYVTGIAFEYCVRATCLDTIRLKKKVVLIEPLVRSVSKDKIVLAKQWDKLINAGVIRAQRIDELG